MFLFKLYSEMTFQMYS